MLLFLQRGLLELFFRPLLLLLFWLSTTGVVAAAATKAQQLNFLLSLPSWLPQNEFCLPILASVSGDSMSSIQPHELKYLLGKPSPLCSDKFVSITDLEKEDCPTSINSVLLCEVLTYKLAEKENERPKMYNRAKQPIHYTYERLIKMKCLFSSEGVNVFNILLSRHRNAHIFDFYLEGRG
jgi:hypothetical protein